WGIPSRMKPFRSHANFCSQGKKRRHYGWHYLGGHHEHKPIRHLHQLALGYDVSLALRVVRADKFVAQPDFAAEICSPVRLSEKRIGCSFDHASLDSSGDEHSAQSWAGLEQNVLDGRA